MKKIGILTFHYTDNYGAVIQAWALRKVMNRLPDCEAELINYVPRDYKIRPYGTGDAYWKQMCQKREKYQDFLHAHCGIHTPMLYSLENTDYDYYCVGSDQVWNVALRENADMQYFLPHIPEEKIRFAYAASVGRDISEGEMDVFRKYLPNFDFISLREVRPLETVRDCSGKDPVCVLDPSLLIEKESYEELTADQKQEEEPFIFFFWYPCGEAPHASIATVNRMAGMLGCKVIHTVLDVPDSVFVAGSKNVFYCGVEEFLWYMKHAKAVVTNSFHGAALSLQFEKLFYLVGPNVYNVRLQEFVKKFQLEQVVLRGYVSEGDLRSDRDYEKVRKILENERASSMDYLRKVLAVDE